VRFIALSFFFYVPNVARFDAGTLKLQRMIKWDVLGTRCITLVYSCAVSHGIRHGQATWRCMESDRNPLTVLLAKHYCCN